MVCPFIVCTFTNAVSRTDIESVAAYFRASGARNVVIETGQVVTPKISRRLNAAIEKGEPFLGGQPKKVREVGPSIIPGDPPICEYEIHF